MVSTFSALMLLFGWQEGYPACKNWVVRYWRGYLSGARCKWFAYGPADATATSSPLAPVKPEWFTFLVPAYPGCPGKRMLNGCSTSSRNSLPINQSVANLYSAVCRQRIRGAYIWYLLHFWSPYLCKKNPTWTWSLITMTQQNMFQSVVYIFCGCLQYSSGLISEM